MDASQNEEGNILNLLQKEGVPRKGGVPSEKGGSNPGGNYEIVKDSKLNFHIFHLYILRKVAVRGTPASTLTHVEF